jgi:ABC-2 type transport system permease protein
MKTIAAITGKELKGFMLSPVAYWVAYHFTLFASFFFLTTTFVTDQPAQLQGFFSVLIWFLIILVPSISMRQLSEELHDGTIESLVTAPVSDHQIVLGKWLGGFLFYAFLIGLTLVYAVVLEIWSDPEPGPILSGYLGLLLVGGMYLAIGVFASAITRDQIIAFHVAIFLIEIVAIGTLVLPQILPEAIAEPVAYLSVNRHYEYFTRGRIDASNVIYFLSGTALFLVMTMKLLESRRWR